MGTNFGIMNLKVQCQGNKFLKPCSVKARFSHGTQVHFPPVCTVEIYAFGSPMLGNPYSKIWEIFAGGIRNRGKFYSLKRNPGLWNPEYSSRYPEYPSRLESRIQVLLTKTGIQSLESGIHCMESRIQDYPGFRDGASLGLRPHGTNLTPPQGGYSANICVYVSR